MELFTIKNKQVHTDYSLSDWTKFIAVTAISLTILLYGMLFYIDSFLIPGLEGFTLNLEITSDWLVNDAESHAEAINSQYTSVDVNNAEAFIEDIRTKKEIISDTANEILISWIAMGMGLLVPMWVVWKIHRIFNYICNKFIKIDKDKKMIYTKEVLE